MSTQEPRRIDDLHDKIYDRDFKSEPLSPHQEYSEKNNSDVGRAWQHDASEVFTVPTERAPSGSFFKKIFIGSMIFFLASAGLLVYMFFNGWNIVSANKVDITFLGPVTVSSGDELSFDILINNENRSAITHAVLYIDYPDGTKKVENVMQDLLHEKETIGEVAPKTSARRTSRSIQFGELNAVRDIKITLEYGLKNSSATYRKEKTYDVTVSSTPLAVEIEHPQEVVSNDTVEYKAKITSNSSIVLNNLVVRAEYSPFGFAFVEANPKPAFDNNVWIIPKLNPSESVEITFRGLVQGEQGDERVVRLSVGTQNPQNEKMIATRYISRSESVFLKRPPVSLAVDLNGSTQPKIVTEQGVSIQGSVEVVNNLPVKVSDVVVSLKFSGELFDPASVTGIGSFYRSSTRELIWDKSTLSRFVNLDPGAKVNLSFSFSTLPPTAVAVKNGTMSLQTTLSARRVGDASTEVVTTTQEKKILSQTTIGLVTRGVYSVGPFRNRGPIPPKVDTPTTYTIVWNATNSLNDVRGGEVRATLPVNVKWLGVTSPQNESVTWNQDKNEVVWRVGDVVAGTGSAGRSAREVAFQVELTPSLSQADTIVTLVPPPVFTATDSFTNGTLSVTGKEVTTRLSTDPRYGDESSKVKR